MAQLVVVEYQCVLREFVFIVQCNFWSPYNGEQLVLRVNVTMYAIYYDLTEKL